MALAGRWASLPALPGLKICCESGEVRLVRIQSVKRVFALTLTVNACNINSASTGNRLRMNY